jgi:glycosyltransferase involved in cell wall biosynthesis
VINVLILIHNLRVANGVASFAMNYFRDLDPSEVHVDFALYADRPSPYYDEIRMRGSDIYILPKVSDIKEHLKKCNEILSAKKYDIVHDNTLHISIPMMFCAKKKNIPVRILHSHNTKMGETSQKELRNKILLPVLRSLATDYAACSQLAGEAMFGKRKFTVIPNVIRTDKYQFDPAVRERVRQDMNVQGKLIVGTVGRLAEQKNPFFAIDVFACLLKKLHNAEYWWVGSGPLQEQVKNYIEKNGLSEYVRLLGNRNDVLELYQGMDAFFLPSLFEGLPLTGVEAQAMGLPMVVSDTITDEMIYSDLVDYIGLNVSEEVWAEHLKKALGRNAERSGYIHELERSKFSNAGCGKKLIEIYRKML